MEDKQNNFQLSHKKSVTVVPCNNLPNVPVKGWKYVYTLDQSLHPIIL